MKNINKTNSNVIVNANLMVENVIQINSGVMIYVDVSLNYQ